MKRNSLLIIVGVAIFLLTLTIDLATDYYKWKAGQNVDHVWGAIVRGIALAGCVVLLGWRSVFAVLLLYWILFNGILNLLMGQYWFRIGETSWLDILEGNNLWIGYLKYILVIPAIVFYGISEKKKPLS